MDLGHLMAAGDARVEAMERLDPHVCTPRTVALGDEHVVALLDGQAVPCRGGFKEATQHLFGRRLGRLVGLFFVEQWLSTHAKWKRVCLGSFRLGDGHFWCHGDAAP